MRQNKCACKYVVHLHFPRLFSVLTSDMIICITCFEGWHNQAHHASGQVSLCLFQKPYPITTCISNKHINSLNITSTGNLSTEQDNFKKKSHNSDAMKSNTTFFPLSCNYLYSYITNKDRMNISMPNKSNKTNKRDKWRNLDVTLASLVLSYQLVSSYFPQQIQQSVPDQEEFVYPFDTLLQMHQLDQQIEQTQIPVVLYKRQKKIIFI